MVYWHGKVKDGGDRGTLQYIQWYLNVLSSLLAFYARKNLYIREYLKTRLQILEKLWSEFLFRITWFQSFFGPECSDWGFHWCTFTHRPILTPPPPPLRSRPNTFVEGLSIVFEPSHFKEKPILRKFELSCLQVEEKTTETETAPPELWVSFRVPTDFQPMSDRNRDQNLQPSLKTVLPPQSTPWYYHSSSLGTQGSLNVDAPISWANYHYLSSASSSTNKSVMISRHKFYS
jgi:hypothetical protein